MKIISLYIITGVIWQIWLEYFTRKALEAPYNVPWNNSERIFHIVLWPITLTTFIYSFIKEILENKGE